MKKAYILLGVLAAFAVVGVAWAQIYRSAQTYVSASPVTGSAPASVCTNVSSPATSACGVNLAGVEGVRVCVASKNLTTGAPSGVIGVGGSVIGYLYDLEPDINGGAGPGARWKYNSSLTLQMTNCIGGSADCCFSDVTTRVKHGRAIWVPVGVTYSGGSATGVEVSEEAYYGLTPR